MAASRFSAVSFRPSATWLVCVVSAQTRVREVTRGRVRAPACWRWPDHRLRARPPAATATPTHLRVALCVCGPQHHHLVQAVVPLERADVLAHRLNLARGSVARDTHTTGVGRLRSRPRRLRSRQPPTTAQAMHPSNHFRVLCAPAATAAHLLLLAALDEVVCARLLVGRDECGVEDARQRHHVAHVGHQLLLQLKVQHLMGPAAAGDVRGIRVRVACCAHEDRCAPRTHRAGMRPVAAAASSLQRTPCPLNQCTPLRAPWPLPC
jgi:hypothetical protein